MGAAKGERVMADWTKAKLGAALHTSRGWERVVVVPVDDEHEDPREGVCAALAPKPAAKPEGDSPRRRVPRRRPKADA